jgi:hypothetical protein
MALRFDPSNTPPEQQFGGPPGYFEPPKPKLNPFQIAKFVTVGIMALSFVGLFVFLSWNKHEVANNLAKAEASESASPSDTLNVKFLTLGKCFDEPAGQSAVKSVKEVDCTQPHDAQVIGSHMLEVGSYDDATVKSEADDACQKAASSILVDQSKLSDNANIIDFLPTADSWKQGDRDVTCAVDNGTGTKLTGSVMK